jgi:gamma-glutamyl hercynylcysteine S-oxide hydrolase
MCRHIAYLGPPRTLAELLFDPPHSLQHQCWEPDDMRGGGTVNVDGFGAGWYLAGRSVPVRYRRAVPMWTDLGFAAVAQATSSGAVLAAIRSATVGMPIMDSACAPFADGPWLFSHNGKLPGWPSSAEPLARTLPPVELYTLDAPTDSALLWAMVRHRLRAGHTLADAITDVVAAAAATVPGARLNFLLTDGTTVVASTWTHSLSVRRSGGVLSVCSEPTDTGAGWQAVADRQLVVADRSTLDIRPLSFETAPPFETAEKP